MFHFASKFYSLHLFITYYYAAEVAQNIYWGSYIHMRIVHIWSFLTRFLQIVNDFDWMHVIYLIYCDFIHSLYYIYRDRILCTLPFICQIHSIPIHRPIHPSTHTSINLSDAIILCYMPFRFSVQQKSSVNAGAAQFHYIIFLAMCQINFGMHLNNE